MKKRDSLQNLKITPLFTLVRQQSAPLACGSYQPHANYEKPEKERHIHLDIS